MQKQLSTPDGDAGNMHTIINRQAATSERTIASVYQSFTLGQLPEDPEDQLQSYSDQVTRWKSNIVIRNKSIISPRKAARRGGHDRDLPIPAQIWDFQEKYDQIMIKVSPQMLYVLDRVGVLSYNPFHLPGMFEWCKNSKTLGESWYCTGIAIEHVQKGKRSSPTLLLQQAKSCLAINQSLGSLERGPMKKWAETRAIISMAFIAVGVLSIELFLLTEGLTWRFR